MLESRMRIKKNSHCLTSSPDGMVNKYLLFVMLNIYQAIRQAFKTIEIMITISAPSEILF